MAEYIAKEDIFDEHGILLISKGKKLLMQLLEDCKDMATINWIS